MYVHIHTHAPTEREREREKTHSQTCTHTHTRTLAHTPHTNTHATNSHVCIDVPEVQDDDSSNYYVQCVI